MGVLSERNSKPILVYHLFGNYIGEYKSASDYAEQIGVVFSAFCNAAKFYIITCITTSLIIKNYIPFLFLLK